MKVPIIITMPRCRHYTDVLLMDHSSAAFQLKKCGKSSKKLTIALVALTNMLQSTSTESKEWTTTGLQCFPTPPTMRNQRCCCFCRWRRPRRRRLLFRRRCFWWQPIFWSACTVDASESMLDVALSALVWLASSQLTYLRILWIVFLYFIVGCLFFLLLHFWQWYHRSFTGHGASHRQCEEV